MSPHVIDWSTATARWTTDGFQLAVNLASAATERQAETIAAALTERLRDTLRPVAFEVTPLEPEDRDPAQLLVTSAQLLTVDPQRLRAVMNEVADSVANQVVGAEAADDVALDSWLRAIRD